MKWLAAIALLVAPLMGCTQTWMPLRSQTVAARRPQTMALVMRKQETFDAVIPGGQPLGLASAIAGTNDGPRIVKEYGLVDPSFKLGNSLANGLSKKYALASKVIVQTAPREMADGVPSEAWPPPVEGVDLVLSVRTSSWGFGTVPGGGPAGARYHFNYHFQVSLTDIRYKSVLAQGDCRSYAATLHLDPPTYEQLLANNAAVLKQQIADAIDICLDDYESRLFFTTAMRGAPLSRPQQEPSSMPP